MGKILHKSFPIFAQTTAFHNLHDFERLPVKNQCPLYYSNKAIWNQKAECTWVIKAIVEKEVQNKH